MTVCSLDFTFLSARFSLSDFPDFFDMDLRGDLSDIIGPSIGNLNGSRCLDGTPHPAGELMKSSDVNSIELCWL
jgi:hypothetical protein